MKFVYPNILWFLTALAVPVIIHLLKLKRYKREYFSNVAMLEQIQQEKSRSAKLRERLILAARLFTMAAVVLAFAQPYFPSKDSNLARSARTVTAIYLDNSFSMQAPSKESVLLEEAKNKVLEILGTLPPDAQVFFFTNAFAGGERNLKRTDDVKRLLRDLDYCAVPRSFAEVCRFQRGGVESASVAPSCRVCYYVSDFQKSTFRLQDSSFAQKFDTQTLFAWVPVQGVPYANLSLDSLSFSVPVMQPGRDMGLNVTLTNHGSKEQLQVPLRIYVNNVQTAVYPVDFAPGKTVQMQLPFQVKQPGLYRCYAEIADYPIDFDNRMYFSFCVEPSPRVLHIYKKDYCTAVAKVFGGGTDSGFTYMRQGVDNLIYGDIASCRLVVLDGLPSLPSGLGTALDAFLQGGGSIAVIPPADSTEDYLGEWLQNKTGSGYGKYNRYTQRIRYINTQHPVFSLALASTPNTNLLPQAQAYYRLPPCGAQCPNAYTALLGFSPREAPVAEDFLRLYTVNKGLLYLFASNLNPGQTDFTAHYTFVVGMLNMALYEGSVPRLYYPSATGEGLYAASPHTGDGRDISCFYLTAEKSGGESVIPSVRKTGGETVFYTYGQIGGEGNYRLSADNMPDSALQWFSFNYNRCESRPQCYSPKELQRFLNRRGDGGNLRAYISADGVKPPGARLWKIFVYLALAGALAEALLHRRTGLDWGTGL